MSSSRAERPGASLFVRLLLAQLGLALGLAAVIGVLFYVERNVTKATLFADLWAPRLAAAAGLPNAASPPAAEDIALVRTQTEPPERARTPSFFAPRFIALRQALRAQGLEVAELRLELAREAPRLWLRLDRPDDPRWYGVPGRMVFPEWSRRALLALVLSALLVLGLSWALARRLARPLEDLRRRLDAQQPLAEADRIDHDALRGAPPEIAAIAAAYGELLARWQRHERERALLLAGVSHDLRSPLGRIRMAVELLPDDPVTARRKATVTRNVAEADRLIESFLDFVRSGELPCDETVDLIDAARAVVATFDRPEHELALEGQNGLEVPDAALNLVDVNGLLVERLIANLIDNALKHGLLPVRVRVLATPGDGAQLAVEDAGSGLLGSDGDALQEAFRRGDSARSRPGSGLGLAIVRQVAMRTGASLRVERKGTGQRVVVEWPRAEVDD